ncbi:MAG: outer membrane protein transport protein [Thiotrichales bacterium]|nr:outer membrane protein transport protein [Thiotrichales bacterium]
MKRATLTAAILMALSSQSVYAAGFGLIEQSASGQGLSYAGAAVNTEDASVMWFNPAGLSDIEGNQIVGALHIILPNAPFKNDGSYIDGVGPLFGAEDDGAQNALVPNFYWKGQYQDYDIGLGINVPYGSVVDYDQDWVGRYHAVYTETKTVNINPAISRKVNDQLSLGAGLNAQYIRVNLTQKIDFGLGSQQEDGYADLQASGWGFGFNLGMLYKFENQSKLGLSYRSKIRYDAKGDADFTNAPYADQAIKASVDLPETVSMSYEWPVSEKTKLLADATWTGWSVFDELRIEFADKDDSVQPEEWNDVMRYSVGMIHQYNSKWTARAGVAYDETPIENASLRTPRIADSNRTWLSVGAGYQLNDAMRLDVAYSHLWGGNPKINATDADPDGVDHVLVGEFDINVDIISAQLVWNY